MKRILIATMAMLLAFTVEAKDYSVVSPDGKTSIEIKAGATLTWSVAKNGHQILAPSELALTLTDGTVYGRNVKFRKAARSSAKESFDAPIFKRSKVEDQYNQLKLSSKDFDVIFRACNDGVAYRFVTKKGVEIAGETARFNFPGNPKAWIPYVRDKGTIEEQFFNSFENFYAFDHLSDWDASRLAFLPLTVETVSGEKVSITEADLLNYPGMYLINTDASSSVEAKFAGYPKTVVQGGHNMLQGIVTSRENYIYKGEKGEALPWRVLVIADEDRFLAENDLVWRLSKPSEGDFSWVKPGKVAWDWWNDWNLKGVDFVSGINNETYKYYIDFAAAHGIEYVILDEGWAVNLQADLFQVIPEIDLPEIVNYANSKGVGIILWAGYWAMNRDVEGICKHFSEMGVKGFKIDFMNRDDQLMVDFYRNTAEIAARYHLLVDYHGAFKPSGLQRPYPNVINHEGVAGLEQMKWAQPTVDQVTYDVQIPFIRMFAGPLDYTQGAMRNATRRNYRPVNTEPMSQGTRCRQLAEYVIFEAPLTMLCDSPSNYLAEPECLRWMAAVPTVWDETVALDGKLGDYAAIARRKGGDWYVGAMTDWDARDLSLDLSAFLPEGRYSVEIFRDGPNADRAARDFLHDMQTVTVSAAQHTLPIHMAPGGGWTAKFTRL